MRRVWLPASHMCIKANDALFRPAMHAMQAGLFTSMISVHNAVRVS